MLHRQTRRAQAAPVSGATPRCAVPHPPVPGTGDGTGAPGRSLTLPHRGRVHVVLWRVAAVAFLAVSSLSAALLSSSLTARGAIGPAAALATDAAVLCAAGLAVAVTAKRGARLTVAAVTTLQVLAVSAARHGGGWPAQRGSQSGDMTRLLCAGAVAVVALALLSWLDSDHSDAAC